MESVLLIAYVLLAAVFVGLPGLGWLLWQMLRQQGRLLLRLEAVEARQNAARQTLPASSNASSRLEVSQPAPIPRLVNGPGETLRLQVDLSRRKVFGIGLSKTGTTSLTEALELLGYRTGHGSAGPATREEVYRFFATGSEHIHLSVLDSNYYNALTDTPVCCIYQALDKAYPGSKFILTIREKDAWLRSYQRQWETSDRFSGPGSHTALAHYTRFVNQKQFGHPGRQEATAEILSPAYDRYVAEVLDYFKERPQDLLILDICGGEGWSKLAPFLGVPIPEVPFPWKNRTPKQKVFGIGLSKTGTTSLNKALKLLGYRALHWPRDPVTQSEVYQFFATGEASIQLSVLNDYDALTDTPACYLYQALDKAYPGSKFILTSREKQGWLRSYQDHWHRYLSSSYRAGPESVLAHYTRFLNERFSQSADPAVLSPAYDRHTAEVIEYFKERPHDLLVLDICGGEGWSKLAPFLGMPMPEIPFPWKNRTPQQEEPGEGKRETSDATQWQPQEVEQTVRV